MPMTAPKVSIIVLNYNGLHFLEPCLSSIRKQTYSRIETIVVDNNSTDGSVEFLLKVPEIRLVRNRENYGYAKANNIGATEAQGELLLFLNNDTELFPNMIESLVANYKIHTIVAPAQILESNRLSDYVGMAGNGADIFGYPYGEFNAKKTKLFYVDGAGIFVAKSDFFSIGMFDEELFIFEEDIDFSWRARLMGYTIVSCWESKFYHYSGGVVLGGAAKEGRYATSYFRRYLNEKNVIRNIIKNYSWYVAPCMLSAVIFLDIGEAILLCIMGEGRAAWCYVKALYWNIKNFPNSLAFRKKVQRQRVVSDWSILKAMYFRSSKITAFCRVGMPKFR